MGGIGAYASDTPDKLGRGTDSLTGARIVCGPSYVARFLSRHTDLRKFKSSALDPLRVKQAISKARQAARIKTRGQKKPETERERGGSSISFSLI